MIDAAFRKVCLDKQVNKMAVQVAEGACVRIESWTNICLCSRAYEHLSTPPLKYQHDGLLLTCMHTH